MLSIACFTVEEPTISNVKKWVLFCNCRSSSVQSDTASHINLQLCKISSLSATSSLKAIRNLAFNATPNLPLKSIPKRILRYVRKYNCHSFYR